MGPGHDLSPVEVAAGTLASRYPATIGEWKAALLAGLALGCDLGSLVAIAHQVRSPEMLGAALQVAARAEVKPQLRIPRMKRLLVSTWPEGR